MLLDLYICAGEKSPQFIVHILTIIIEKAAAAVKAVKISSMRKSDLSIVTYTSEKQLKTFEIDDN